MSKAAEANEEANEKASVVVRGNTGPWSAFILLSASSAHHLSKCAHSPLISLQNIYPSSSTILHQIELPNRIS
ncbi:hypothetical protein NQZ68_021671 [Dissostichus eleginoides]|nr:hypothetical protein NQZ68_021671 [Dissostichus eleginoides]